MPLAMPDGTSQPGRAKSVNAPAVVTRPTLSRADSVNHSAPSAPVVMALTLLPPIETPPPRLPPAVLMWATPPAWPTQRLPSGPTVMARASEIPAIWFGPGPPVVLATLTPVAVAM